MTIIKPVFAHCDGPCGHYETDTLKNSASTCLKLVEKILNLKDDDKQAYVRLTMLKEEHAQICKNQIYILWSDFFKVHHYQQYNQLHNKLYLLAQQCSLVKQTVDLKTIQHLIDLIAELDVIFDKAK